MAEEYFVVRGSNPITNYPKLRDRDKVGIIKGSSTKKTTGEKYKKIQEEIRFKGVRYLPNFKFEGEIPPPKDESYYIYEAL